MKILIFQKKDFYTKKKIKNWLDVADWIKDSLFSIIMENIIKRYQLNFSPISKNININTFRKVMG